MKKLLKFRLVILGLILLAWYVRYGYEDVKGDMYAPPDLKQFFVVTYDTAYYPTLADVDSVKFFYRYNGNTYYDTTLTTSQDDSGGVYIREASVCNLWDDPAWCDSTGSWGYYARAWSGGATLSKGAKTWDWTVELKKAVYEAYFGKLLYAVPDADAISGGSCLSPGDACSISTVLARCTGASEYYIYVAPGTYKDVEITDDVGNTHWIGAGVGQTIVWGKQDVVGGLGSKYIFRLVTTSDSSAVEITGFDFRGYEATGGVEDSATFRVFQINEPTSGFYIHDNFIYNFQEGFFICASTSNGRIENNWISKPLDKGFHIVGGSNHYIANNVVDSLGAGDEGFYVAGAHQGHIVYYNNIIRAPQGKGFYFNATSERGVVINNFVIAEGDSAFVDAGDNYFVANHRRSQISDPQTLEEDLYTVHAEVDSVLHALGYDPDSTLLAFLQYIRNNQSDYKATGFSTHGASDVATLWGDTLNQLLITVDSIITTSGFDADTTLLTFLRYIRNNQTDYKATGFSTHGASDVATLWGDTLNQLLVTIDSVIASMGYDADTTLLTFLRYIRNNQSDYKATGFATHSAADVKTLWGDTLNQLLVTIDSVITATGFDPDSTLLAFLQYVRNNQADYKADVSGLSTFDPASDNVAVVDSVTGVGRVDSVRKVYILDSLDQTVTASIDSDQVSRAVHYVSTSTYGDSTGSMGKALVDAASCNPSGANTIIIRLKRDSDSTAIIGAWVEVKTNATTYYIEDTDNDGKVQFSSDNDTLFVYPKFHPIAFTHPETLFIDGNEDTTYYGTPHSPSSPPTDTVCIVYGWVKRSGVGIEGAKVKMWLPQFPVTFHGVIIDAINPVTVLTDSTGYFEFSDGWYPNSVLLPANTRYIFRVDWKGLKFEKKLEVPLQNSWEIELNLP